MVGSALQTQEVSLSPFRKSNPCLSVISSCICWDLEGACSGFAGQLLIALSGSWGIAVLEANKLQIPVQHSQQSVNSTECIQQSNPHPCRWAGNALLTLPLLGLRLPPHFTITQFWEAITCCCMAWAPTDLGRRNAHPQKCITITVTDQYWAGEVPAHSRT